MKKIPRLGAKTYEQAIGFLRVPNAKELFDGTGIHPESYGLAEEILKDAGITKNKSGQLKLSMHLIKYRVNN